MLEKIKSLIPHLKGAIRSKTINLNFAIVIVAVLSSFIFPALAPMLNNTAMLMAALINIYLRTVTVKSLIEKGKK